MLPSYSREIFRLFDFRLLQHNTLEASKFPAISEVQRAILRGVGFARCWKDNGAFRRDTGACTDEYTPQLVGGLHVAFITAGDCDLEFLQNVNPAQDGQIQHGSSGTTRQDQGSITRCIASHGAGLHHVAFKTADINGTLAKLNERGIETIVLLDV